MIPKIIHYCWFGRGEMPKLALKCIESWHKYMPDWEYKLWNEDNFDVNSVSYVKEAYEAGKFAFVSDFVRLIALHQYGGVYFDTDVMVFKPFDELLSNKSFVGFEGSKRLPVGTCVMGSIKGAEWLADQLSYYKKSRFIYEDGTYNLTTNVVVLTAMLVEKGLVCDGNGQDIYGVHVFPVDYFSPRRTTGEYICTDNTYSDHLGVGSWGVNKRKPLLLRIAGPKLSVYIIKVKRKVLG